MISGRRQSTVPALVPSLAQCLWDSCAAQTGLRSAARVNLHQLAPSFCRFVLKLCDEGRPSGIVNRFGKHPARQSFDIQIFNRNDAVMIDECAAELVVKVRALVPDVRMCLLQQQDSFPASVTASLATRHLALRSPEFSLCRAVVARVVNFRSVRERDEGRQSDIKADSFSRLRQRLRLFLWSSPTTTARSGIAAASAS